MRQLLALCFFLSCIVGHAGAADHAGVVKTARGTVALDRAGTAIAVQPGTRIEQGDRLTTAADGFVGITRRDDTLLTLGPSTRLTLDDYAFDAKTHDGRFGASLLKGVLHVVTGLLPKRAPDSFVLKTRISTMGVRGTEFIVDAGGGEDSRQAPSQDRGT